MRTNFRTNSGVQFEMLSKDQLQAIYEGVLHVLEYTGLDVQHEEARDILEKAGAWVDGERVRLPSHLVRRSLDLAPRSFTTNSRRALLLGRTVYRHNPARFPPLHRALLHAYFAEGRNIGDPEVLREIADHEQVADLLPSAWEQSAALEGLLEDTEAARQAGVSGVPALRIGGRTFPGADALDILEQALERQGEAEG